MSKIKFLTDSASDIPKQYVEQYDITVLPFPIALADREILDNVDLTPAEFYEVLLRESKIPSHSQLLPIQFTECYEAAYEQGYTDLIYTAINFKGSNTGNNALLARDAFYQDHPEAKGRFQIHVIDSTTYTFAYGYAVVQGARRAAEGANIDKVLEVMRDWLEHNKILFSPFDLQFARKSGRVSAAAAILGGAMGICPVMTFLDGESKVVAKPRGEKNVFATYSKLVTEEMKPGTPYICIQGSRGDHNEKLIALLTEQIGYPPAEVFQIGGVIAINAGPDLVGVIYYTE